MTNTELNEIWLKALEYLKDEVNDYIMSEYINPLNPEYISVDSLYLSSPSAEGLNVLNSKYNSAISRAVSFATRTTSEHLNKTVIFLRNNTASTNVVSEPVRETTVKKNDMYHAKSVLNPKYTFENFVPGSNSLLAHAAAKAVAQHPATKYNPLFIYGSAGLGKTHLMQAIAHEILNTKPNLKVLYTTSEDFLNDFIESIHNQTSIQFRNRYRNIDVLLVDDIQFIAGKKETQEEFFNTFNTLYENQKQIVISSDKPSKEIDGFDDRMITRFEWGLNADIQPPDIETRIAILKKKSENEDFEVSNDVLEYIAERNITNIRELEGVLIRVKAQCELRGITPSMDNISEILGENSLKRTKKITSDEVIKKVCSYYRVTYSDILSTKRPSNLATARQVAMYLTRELTDLSLPEIGKDFGGKDHTTVYYAHEKIKTLVDANDTKIVSDVNAIIKSLSEN